MKSSPLRNALKLCLATALCFLGPVSCQLFTGCPDYKPYFDIVGIYTYNAKFTGAGLDPWEMVEEDETVDWDKFFIQVAFDVTFVASSQSSATSSLYATSCDENGERGAKVGIDTLYLIALSDYNELYLQNDTLNEIVHANDFTFTRYADGFYNFYPLAEYIEQNDAAIKKYLFELQLSQPPFDGEGQYQFKLIYVLDDGDILEHTSAPVKLRQDQG